MLSFKSPVPSTEFNNQDDFTNEDQEKSLKENKNTEIESEQLIVEKENYLPKYIKDSDVNIRIEPGLKSEIIFIANLNQEVDVDLSSKIKKDDIEWVKIKVFNNNLVIDGWVSNDLLSDNYTDYKKLAIKSAYEYINNKMVSPSSSILNQEHTDIIDNWHPKYLIKLSFDSQNKNGVFIRYNYAVCLKMSGSKIIFPKSFKRRRALTRKEEHELAEYKKGIYELEISHAKLKAQVEYARQIGVEDIDDATLAEAGDRSLLYEHVKFLSEKYELVDFSIKQIDASIDIHNLELSNLCQKWEI